MISLLVSDFRKISVSVPSIPVAVLALDYNLTRFLLFAALCSGKAREGLIWPSIGRSKREKHNQTKLDFLQKSFSSASIVDGIETSSVLRQKDGLKTGSDKIIY